jgi:hypothetical protein
MPIHAVTAEAAGSSPVVQAIPTKALESEWSQKPQPKTQSTTRVLAIRLDSALPTTD